MIDRATMVITGASDGIGAAAARQLAARGRHVVLVGRSLRKTATLANDLQAPYHLADFGDLAQVRALADELLAKYPRIDVLANNAGGIFGPETTKDGFDKTFQVNHLAPFLLTNLLIGRLIESRASVIQTSSRGARQFGRLDLDDLNNDRKWKPNKAYGDSKLANILFTKELHRRCHAQGLNAVAFHPGNVATNFANDTTSWVRLAYRSFTGRLAMDDAVKGGATLNWFIEGTPGRTWRPGEYYEHKEIAPPEKTNPQAFDHELAWGLWARSEAMLGVNSF